MLKKEKVLRDHLGNNRLVVDEHGAIKQVNHYYPFGGLMGESQNFTSTQRYKYNGKELNRMHGLDWYDYGARHFDASIGRWMCVDPLAEKYYPISPYVYCLDNPVRFIDEDGMDPGDRFQNMYLAAMDFAKLYNPRSIHENREYSTSIFLVKDTRVRDKITMQIALIVLISPHALAAPPACCQ
ncbi:RHS repeat-associated core domain-containing protein, partial [Prevotella sp. KH2C16]|uniref:RHS repeat-associated core domain-containing protein n=1 Tax=Prevotella sp. KH2C16 TaxID=1855325 RepID=UPI0008E3E89E